METGDWRTIPLFLDFIDLLMYVTNVRVRSLEFNNCLIATEIYLMKFVLFFGKGEIRKWLLNPHNSKGQCNLKDYIIKSMKRKN